VPGPDSPFETVLGEPRARRLIKELLAHVGRVRPQRWISLEFPEERIQSRLPAVQAIARGETGCATAIQHVPIEGLTPTDEGTERFLEAVAPLEQTPPPGVRGFHVDLAVSLGFGPTSVDLKLLANGLRGWCARQIETAPEGRSRHVITLSGRPVRLQMEKTRCLEGPGRLAVFRAELPATFARAVSEGLRAWLYTLLQASADRHVLLFEQQDHRWSPAHLRTELEASFEFPELSRVHEIWIVDARSLKLGEIPAFRQILPVNARPHGVALT
jgi:hypothetical protein